jgi:hypothetical protein
MAHGAAVWARAAQDGGLDIHIRFPSGPKTQASQVGPMRNSPAIPAVRIVGIS